MRQSNDITNTFIAKGDSGSAERRAAILQFKADTGRAASQLQALIDKQVGSPRYLKRTLQDYVDGTLLYSENMYPDLVLMPSTRPRTTHLWWPMAVRSLLRSVGGSVVTGLSA